MSVQTETGVVLHVDAVSKRFGSNQALSGVDFTVPEASLTVILGPAGAGKTTILRTIAGLEMPDEGRVILGGEDVGSWEPRHRNVAMIFDNLALYPNKNGYDNIASPLVIKGESDETIRERVDAIAATLQISHVLGRLPKTMSGGEKQRVALGRALIRTPQLFLLDEPLSSLDAKLRVELRAELRRMQRDHGYTFLLATPDYHEALAVADTVIMLNKGRVVQVDRPQVVYDDPADRDTAIFVGAPQINLLKSTHLPNSGEMLIELAGVTLRGPAHLVGALKGTEGSFELGIRPENLFLGDAGESPIQGKLADIEPLGPKSVATVAVKDEEFRVLIDSKAVPSLALGQSIGIGLTNEERMLAFDLETGLRLRA
ncbi:ATP-binding cassette domain-containing protein [Pseudodesulfovibrio cashew]|uniref:ATP-binding cassette domain-containing protein n=1 Tax=Pseudodesulfovibrio cashew TaxID=2678688 RepID=A0A6I6JKB3_9BACT|nr:ABC transporter ATP-binding protein [Pseudodesulfovibrio cashew]QGY40557.1 ATP-binding cassette domain-containing protein [Pseudodesulfovibrio cashew]